MNHYFKIYLLGIMIGLLFFSARLNAQDRVDDSSRLITIGELQGRIDIQSLIYKKQDSFYFLSKAQQAETYQFYKNTRNNLVVRVNQQSGTSLQETNLLRYHFFESEWSLISALIIEEIDFARLISEESAREITRSNRAIHLLPELLPDNTVTMLSFNCAHPVWERIEVRRALSYAVDKLGIVEKLLKKRADLARGPFNRDFEAYEGSLEDFRYNPKKAIKILNNDGWIDANNDGILEDRNGNPLKLELLYRQGLVLDEQLIRWIKINWNQIGVDVKPRPVKYGKFHQLLNSGQFDVALVEHQFEGNVESLERFFSKNSFSRFSSSKLENYFRLYHKMDDPSRKKILIQSAQKVINEEQPSVFLYFKWLVFSFVNRNRIENYLDGDGNLRPITEWQIKTK